MLITEELARKVLDVVDRGLSAGLGKPEPGQMCVEAAVSFALGLPHGDEPSCVSPALRALKISLNDQIWSSGAARATGLRRLAVAQLGSAGVLDDREFATRVAESVIRKQVPLALRAAACLQKEGRHERGLLTAADECERYGTRAAANAAYAAASAGAEANAADKATKAAAAATDAAYAAANAAYAAANAAIDAAKAAAR